MLVIVLCGLAAIRTELLPLVVTCLVLVMTVGLGRHLNGLVTWMPTFVAVLFSRHEPVTPPVELLRQVTAPFGKVLILLWRRVTASRLVSIR